MVKFHNYFEIKINNKNYTHSPRRRDGGTADGVGYNTIATVYNSVNSVQFRNDIYNGNCFGKYMKIIFTDNSFVIKECSLKGKNTNAYEGAVSYRFETLLSPQEFENKTFYSLGLCCSQIANPVNEALFPEIDLTGYEDDIVISATAFFSIVMTDEKLTLTGGDNPIFDKALFNGPETVEIGLANLYGNEKYFLPENKTYQLKTASAGINIANAARQFFADGFDISEIINSQNCYNSLVLFTGGAPCLIYRGNKGAEYTIPYNIRSVSNVITGYAQDIEVNGISRQDLSIYHYGRALFKKIPLSLYGDNLTPDNIKSNPENSLFAHYNKITFDIYSYDNGLYKLTDTLPDYIKSYKIIDFCIGENLAAVTDDNKIILYNIGTKECTVINSPFKKAFSGNAAKKIFLFNNDKILIQGGNNGDAITVLKANAYFTEFEAEKTLEYGQSVIVDYNGFSNNLTVYTNDGYFLHYNFDGYNTGDNIAPLKNVYLGTQFKSIKTLPDAAAFYYADNRVMLYDFATGLSAELACANNYKINISGRGNYAVAYDKKNYVIYNILRDTNGTNFVFNEIQNNNFAKIKQNMFFLCESLITSDNSGSDLYLFSEDRTKLLYKNFSGFLQTDLTVKRNIMPINEGRYVSFLINGS